MTYNVNKKTRLGKKSSIVKITDVDDDFYEGDDPNNSDAEGKKRRRSLWQDNWLSSFKWLIFDNETVRLFCSYCLDYPHARSAYSKKGSKNFKTSNLRSHARTQCHRDARNAKLFGKCAMRVGLRKMQSTQEEALHILFKSAYYVAKNNHAFTSFSCLLDLLRSVSVKNITSLYNDDKACADIVHCIATSIMDETLDKVRQSPWFGVTVDESTDISIHHHMIIYLSYLEDESVPCSTFYGMVRTNDSTSKGIFDRIMHELKNANLDMKKFIAFGSDGCSTMVGRKKGVATLMKRVNPMLTSIHCVAHRTNLVVSDTTKKITYAKHIDRLINNIANYFSSSSNRMEELKIVQEELDCEVIKMQRIFEIRWLSRHGCLAKICKSMDALLCLLAKERMDLHAILSTFECIYAMHFLADILQKLTDLSLRFQRDYVDVSTIHGIVISTIFMH